MNNFFYRAIFFCCLFVLCCPSVAGFATLPLITTNEAKSDMVLRMGNIFDGLGKFFLPDHNDDGDEHIDDEEEGYLGSSRLVSLPVESIKPGGLRLFLMLYLLGIQNSPEKGTWRIDQPTTEEYVGDLYFHDQTAALMILLADEQVTISRMGSRPSMAYIMQETVVLDGILEELQRMATEYHVKREDRLILLKDDNAITSARAALSFG
jgi:hypothetical protein